MSSPAPETRFDPGRLHGERDLERFAHLTPPDEAWWWVPLAVVATAVPVTVGLVGLSGVRLPVGGQLLFGAYWATVVGAWLFSPIALHYDRRYVLATGGWDPSVAYYAVFVPALGALAAGIYVVERHRRVGLRV
ncbi:hypothetical protein [Halorarius litoreus]|uniref:hypothetical protein n=1 Tax=Halorarius litoreus TaxID=2962676 RepID=UPI0020CF767D|nr:hypothetical protein [Halorarius litoreus]